MTETEFETFYQAEKDGKMVALNTEDIKDYAKWKTSKGYHVDTPIQDWVIELGKKLGHPTSEIPTPPDAIGYPILGLYNEIYACLNSGLFHPAALLEATAVEYALKNFIYATKHGYNGFDELLWHKEGLDDKTFGEMIQLPVVTSALDSVELQNLKAFKQKRDDLMHFNLQKLGSSYVVPTQTIGEGVATEEKRWATFTPGAAWITFMKTVESSSLSFFSEANALVHLVWNKKKP